MSVVLGLHQQNAAVFEADRHVHRDWQFGTLFARVPGDEIVDDPRPVTDSSNSAEYRPTAIGHADGSVRGVSAAILHGHGSEGTGAHTCG